jgi:hypothetical protein
MDNFWEDPAFQVQLIDSTKYCRKCKRRPRWVQDGHQSDWCQQCIREQCCDKYPRIIRGKVVEHCIHEERRLQKLLKKQGRK